MESVSITVRIDKDLAEAYGHKREGLSGRVREALLAQLPRDKKLSRVRAAALRAAEDLDIAVEFGSSDNADAVVARIDALRQEEALIAEEPEW